MKYKNLSKLLFLLTLFAVIFSVSGLAVETTMYLFYGESCPHCHDMLGFMNVMEEKYPDLEVKVFEMGDENNQNLLFGMLKEYDEEYQGVPTYFINREYGVGYADSMSAGLENKISACVANGCEDSVSILGEEFVSFAEGSSNEVPKVDYAPAGSSDSSGKLLFFIMLIVIGIGIVAVIRSKDEPKITIINNNTINTAPKRKKQVKKGLKSSKKTK